MSRHLTNVASSGEHSSTDGYGLKIKNSGGKSNAGRKSEIYRPDRKLINEDGGEDKAVFIRAKQGMERYNMSRPEFIKLAVEAGAAYKINSMILVDKAAFEKYLETFRIPAQVL